MNAHLLRQSRIGGVASALFALTLDLVMAAGIASLAKGHLRTGLGALLLALVGRLLLSTWQSTWAERSARTLRNEWRRSLPSYLAKTVAQHELSRNDVTVAIEDVSHQPFLKLLQVSSRVILVGVPLVFWCAGWLSAFIILGLIGLSIPLYIRSGHRSTAAVLKFRERRAVLEGRQLELLKNGLALRALNSLGYGVGEIGAISKAENVAAAEAIAVTMESSLITEFISGVSIGLVAMVVGFGLLEGHISLIRAVAAVLLTSEIFVTIRRFGAEFHREESADEAQSFLLSLESASGSEASTSLLGCRDLRSGRTDQVFTMSLAPGDRLRLTGRSGSGKSTLISILLGWSEPESGVVWRGDAPIAHVSPQSQLFSGTLRENVTLGSAVSDDQVHALLQEVGLTSSRFADLSLDLGPTGDELSAGERARIVLSRGLLSGATLLVIDDIAGILDEEAKASVRRALETRTTLAVLEAGVDSTLLGNDNATIEVLS